jgi:hypothetical protein
VASGDPVVGQRDSQVLLSAQTLDDKAPLGATPDGDLLEWVEEDAHGRFERSCAVQDENELGDQLACPRDGGLRDRLRAGYLNHPAILVLAGADRKLGSCSWTLDYKIRQSLLELAGAGATVAMGTPELRGGLDDRPVKT